MERSKRWKIKSAYGDISVLLADDETVAYVASRMPAVFSACYRVFSEKATRFLSEKSVGFWCGHWFCLLVGNGLHFICNKLFCELSELSGAMREVWPKSVEKVNIFEPSKSLQRAGRSLVEGIS